MTDEATPGSFLGNPLMEEAALWFARMRGPEAECHSRDFEAWLAGGTLHRSAYNRVGEIYEYYADVEARAQSEIQIDMKDRIDAYLKNVGN